MDTNDCTDLQLPDGAYISIIHDYITRSEVTEYMVQLMRLTAWELGGGGRGIGGGGMMEDSLRGGVQSMKDDNWLCQETKVGVALL